MKRQIAPTPEADPVGWFFRLERAVRESDYLIATEARRQLARLGWIVTHQPKRSSVKAKPQTEVSIT